MLFTFQATISQPKPVLAISIGKNYLLIGGKSCEIVKIELPTLKQSVIAGLKKSIRTVTVNDNFFACASYDGSGIVFKDDKFFDIIEGPDTEIKSVAFNDDNTLLAIATREKTVWLFSINDEMQLECTFHDHTQDVKGVKFFEERLFSYSYDRTIKVYEKEDDAWDMIRNIDDHECTVWDVIQVSDTILACDNKGNLYFYESEYLRLMKKVKVSRFPIYKMCRVGDDMFAFILNRNKVCIMDLYLNVIQVIEDRHLLEINSICYCDENGVLGSVCDGGVVNMFVKKDRVIGN